jgi:GNAT superfamily N-acetyltransferase
MTSLADFVVRPAVLADLPYIDHLQRKNSGTLSFYPRIVFERDIPDNLVLTAWLNDEPCGYLYRGPLRDAVRIHQACIQYDVRGYQYGAALVRHLEALGRAAGSLRILLRCGSDVAANGFWDVMGYKCISVTTGGVSRGREINLWEKSLVPRLFDLSVSPSSRKQDSARWHKSGVRQGRRFARGNEMHAYRELVEQQ